MQTNNLTFESDKFKYKSRSILGQSEVPGMTKFLLKKGIVKNEKTANVLLLLITTLSLLASIYIFAVFVFDVQVFNQTPTQTPEQIQAREEARERFNKLREEQRNNTNNTQNLQ